MRADEKGVAGFFEDLPVLMFVLAGTCTLVLSGVWVSKQFAHIEEAREIDREAERLADLIVAELLRGHSDSLPSIRYLSSINLSAFAAKLLAGREYSMNIVELYPEQEWIRAETSANLRAGADTGFASRLLNALTGDGVTATLVVNVLVW